MKNEEMMKSGSVWKAIASMAIPSAVIMILMIFYNIADMFFIARLGDNAQVAAVSVVSPVFSIMSAIAMMLGNGGCTMIAKSFGAGEKDKAKTYSSLCMWTAIVLAVVFIVLALTFVDPLLAFLGAKGDVALYAKKYMIPIVLGSPFMMISTSVALLLHGRFLRKPHWYSGKSDSRSHFYSCISLGCCRSSAGVCSRKCFGNFLL